MNKRHSLSVAALLSALCVLTGESAVFAQQAKKPAPPKPKPPVGTIGTKQMAGTEGQLGTTYSLKEKDFIPKFNLTLISLTYSTKRYSFDDVTTIPLAGLKHLVIRFIVQNPNKEDIEIPSFQMAHMLFQAVGNDNKTYTPDNDCINTFLDTPNLAPGKKYPNGTLKLKPGQKSETVVALVSLPAETTVPKLVVNRGRVGTSEEVVRFDVRDKITSDFGIFADTANPLVPKDEIPAQFGTPYSLSNLEVTLSDLKREPGPLTSDITADDGKEFLIGTISMKNLAAQPRAVWVDCKPIITLVNEDGEKTNFEGTPLKSNRTGDVTFGNVDPLDFRKGIFFFQVPKGTKYKQILVHEANFPELSSRRLVFDAGSL